MQRPQTDEVSARSNSAARAEIIRSACREIADLEKDREAIGAQIREIKQKRIKGDLDMKLADFGAVYRLYGLEDDRRDQFMDTLRECFEALGVGGQLNFLDATKQRTEPAVKANGHQPPAEPAKPKEPLVPEGIHEGETDEHFLARVNQQREGETYSEYLARTAEPIPGVEADSWA